MKYLTLLSVLLLPLLLIISGCNDDPASSGETLSVDDALAEQAAFGWEINDIVGTGSDIQDMTTGGTPSVNQEITGLAGAAKLKAMALEIYTRQSDRIPDRLTLLKPQTDSLYYFYEDTAQGFRTALYYDAETSIARLYEVHYKLPGWRAMSYDSAQVSVNLNNTLDDAQDDFLVGAVRQQLFKEYFMLQQIYSVLSVTDHDGQEITGFEATIDSYYRDTMRLTHRRQYIEINPDRSGTLREDFDFRDNTSSYNTITFYSDYTGTFSRMFRDGTTVNGSFNSIEDDLAGSFNETVDFPDGRYIDRIVKEAIITLTIQEPANILNVDLTRSIYFSNGSVATASLGLEAYEEQDVTVVNIELTKGNGAHGGFTLQATETEAVLNGDWITFNGEYYILIEAEYFIDGSGHLVYRVYKTPYSPGDDPVLIADYYFSPDGLGEGTISYQGDTYMITFDRQDAAQIQRGGRSARINLYRE